MGDYQVSGTNASGVSTGGSSIVITHGHQRGREYQRDYYAENCADAECVLVATLITFSGYFCRREKGLMVGGTSQLVGIVATLICQKCVPLEDIDNPQVIRRYKEELKVAAVAGALIGAATNFFDGPWVSAIILPAVLGPVAAMISSACRNG